MIENNFTNGVAQPQEVLDEHIPVILFVDDDEAILSSIKSLFRKEPYEKYYFSSPVEALKFLEEIEVDLMVVDMRMPEMSGIVFLEKAMAIHPASIKIILSGYEGKKLVLSVLAKGFAHHYLMKPWDDDEFKSLIHKFTHLYKDFEKKKLIQYLNSFTQLPTPPNTNTKLMEILSAEDININDIVKEIEGRPFIVTKLLQIANSVSFGVQRYITSVKDAIILIGIDQVKAIVLSLGVLKKFTELISTSNAVKVQEVWERSMRRAVIAKKIATYWDKPVDKHLIFITSLVVDIGYLVWLYAEPQKYVRFNELVLRKKIPAAEAEIHVFSYSHAVLGALLLELWNFPAKVIYAVVNHHSHACDEDAIKIVQLAGIIEGTDVELEHDESIDELLPHFKLKLRI